MKRRVALLALVLLTTSGFPPPGRAEEPLIHRAPFDPARNTSLEEWWGKFEAVEPTLELTTQKLRGVRDRWRGDVDRAGCRWAQTAFKEIDRDALLQAEEYLIVVEMAAALDEFEGAALACLEHRYFEFEYRLWMAESGVRRLRDRVSSKLAYERRRRSEARP